jgi:hypothetical protein
MILRYAVYATNAQQYQIVFFRYPGSPSPIYNLSATANTWITNAIAVTNSTGYSYPFIFGQATYATDAPIWIDNVSLTIGDGISVSDDIGASTNVGPQGPPGSFGGPATNSIIPDQSNAYDLGSADMPWRDIYASTGSLYLGSTRFSSSSNGILESSFLVETSTQAEVLVNGDFASSNNWVQYQGLPNYPWTVDESNRIASVKNEASSQNATLSQNISLVQDGVYDVTLDVIGINTVNTRLDFGLLSPTGLVVKYGMTTTGNKAFSFTNDCLATGVYFRITATFMPPYYAAISNVSIVGTVLQVSTNTVSIGLQGPQGEQGPPGTNGVDGAQGLPGTNGVDGVEGPQGMPGTNGIDGAQGPPGTNGLDGTDGSFCGFATNSIVPDQSNAYDLGSSDMPWRDIYVSTGSVHIGNTAMSVDTGGVVVLTRIDVIPPTWFPENGDFEDGGTEWSPGPTEFITFTNGRAYGPLDGEFSLFASTMLPDVTTDVTVHVEFEMRVEQYEPVTGIVSNMNCGFSINGELVSYATSITNDAAQLVTVCKFSSNIVASTIQGENNRFMITGQTSPATTNFWIDNVFVYTLDGYATTNRSQVSVVPYP